MIMNGTLLWEETQADLMKIFPYIHLFVTKLSCNINVTLKHAVIWSTAGK